jgi:hypothetical protein
MNAPPFASDLPGAYADGVYALLAVVADPAAHKARLDQLIAQETATKEQIAALNDMSASTRRQNSAAEALTIVLNRRKEALDTREAECDERAKALEQHEGKLSAASLQKRENAVLVRENASKAEAERLAVLRSEYEAKHAKIKGLAGAL